MFFSEESTKLSIYFSSPSSSLLVTGTAVNEVQKNELVSYILQSDNVNIQEFNPITVENEEVFE